MRIIRPLTICVGILLLITGIITAIQTNDFLENSIDTNGEVIKVETYEKPGGGSITNHSYRVYFPVIKFTSSEGQEYTFTSELYSENYEDYTFGKVIPIKYNKTNPQEAELAHCDFYKFSLRISLFGLLLIITGVIWTLSLRKNRIVTKKQRHKGFQ